LKINSLVVCSDRVAADDFAKTMMEMGAPADVKVEVWPVAVGARRLAYGVYDRRVAIVLVETPCDALRLLDYGVSLRRLNIGGMHYQDGKKQIMEAVSVDAEDCACLRELAARGVDVYFQMVPHGEPMKVIDKLPPTC